MLDRFDWKINIILIMVGILVVALTGPDWDAVPPGPQLYYLGEIFQFIGITLSSVALIALMRKAKRKLFP